MRSLQNRAERREDGIYQILRWVLESPRADEIIQELAAQVQIERYQQRAIEEDVEVWPQPEPPPPRKLRGHKGTHRYTPKTFDDNLKVVLEEIASPLEFARPTVAEVIRRMQDHDMMLERTLFNRMLRDYGYIQRGETPAMAIVRLARGAGWRPVH